MLCEFIVYWLTSHMTLGTHIAKHTLRQCISMLSLQHLVFVIKVLQVGESRYFTNDTFSGYVCDENIRLSIACGFVILVTKFDDLLFSHNLFETSSLTLPIFPFATNQKKNFCRF